MKKVCKQHFFFFLFFSCGNPSVMRYDVSAKQYSLLPFRTICSTIFSRHTTWMYVKECKLFPNESVTDDDWRNVYGNCVCLPVCMSRVTHRLGIFMRLVHALVHETNVQQNLNINSWAHYLKKIKKKKKHTLNVLHLNECAFDMHTSTSYWPMPTTMEPTP